MVGEKNQLARCPLKSNVSVNTQKNGKKIQFRKHSAGEGRGSSRNQGFREAASSQWMACVPTARTCRSALQSLELGNNNPRSQAGQPLYTKAFLREKQLDLSFLLIYTFPLSANDEVGYLQPLSRLPVDSPPMPGFRGPALSDTRIT